MNKELYKNIIGKKIISAEIIDDVFIMNFEDVKISLYDGMNQCCEERFMRTDDDVKSIAGGGLLGIIEKEVIVNDSYYTEEICFVEINTDKGCVILKNYNIHNGYYSGFDLKIKSESLPQCTCGQMATCILHVNW